MKFSGEVKGGRLLIDSAALAIALRAVEGRRVVVDISPEKRNRSTSQNSYYWACVVPVIAHMLTASLQEITPGAEGVSNDEAHDALKRRFLGKEVIAGLEVVRSTTGLSTVGFSDYVELCRQFAAEAGFYIPAPGEAPLEVIA